jgi:phosphate transport system protein
MDMPSGSGPVHMVRSFDEELAQLRGLVTRMGQVAGRQVADGVAALVGRDTELAAEVMRGDQELDALEREIEAFCIRLLALRQPMAGDLRLIVSALKVGHDLERIGDYAKNAAKRAVLLSTLPQLGSLNGFGRMAELVRTNIEGAIAALVRGDPDLAAEVWASDAPVDEIYNGIFREMLTHMMEDPRNITAATHLLFVARNLERIGDHATNIAEMAHYAARGVPLEGKRPKADTSASAVAEPRGGA